jgi:hypothetical protein
MACGGGGVHLRLFVAVSIRGQSSENVTAELLVNIRLRPYAPQNCEIRTVFDSSCSRCV